MAKRNNNLTGKRSHGGKPYDVNNSFVKKVATKVTDFIPQRSWISKWFNTSQNNGDILNDADNTEESDPEEEVQRQSPPLKRPRIRMDVTHPPGTFAILPRNKATFNEADSQKEQFPIHPETVEDFLEPPAAGPSGIRRLTSATPAVQTNIRSTATRKAELNLVTSTPANGAINGTDDNSESSESTSGCSSLIPQINRQEAPLNSTYNPSYANRKRFIDDKLNFTNHLQSPRSLFLDSSSRDTLSNRRPSFNASMMNNTPDHASSLSSPFYSGNITFGGANAASPYKRGRTLFNNSNDFQLKVPRRTSIQVKPSNVAGTDSSGMSQTAKRILEALEHFSSPVLDAKRIPVKSANNVSPLRGKKRFREEVGPPTARVGLRHLTRELMVPTVPDLLKLRRRQKLQDTTVAARKIVSARNGPPPVLQEYQLRSDNKKSKFHGKLKTKTKANIDEEETVEMVNLPNVPLPISTLPDFDVTFSECKSVVNRSATRDDQYKFASPIKVTDTSKNLKSINNFTFSKPIVAEEKTTRDSNGYSTILKTPSFESNASATSSTSIPVTNFMWSSSPTTPRLKEKPKNKNSESVVTNAAAELKSGSVMDILGKRSHGTEFRAGVKTNTQLKSESDKDIPLKRYDKIKNDLEEAEAFVEFQSNRTTDTLTKESSKTVSNLHEAKIIVESKHKIEKPSDEGKLEIWECNHCLIRNDKDKMQCVACKTPKPDLKTVKSSEPLSTSTSIVSQSKPISGDCFGSQFKMSDNQWECTSCLVGNKQTEMKCISCNALKPGNKSEANSLTFSAVQPLKSSFMEKFKPPEGSWECPGCMLRNPSNIITCPCCSASKPGSLKISPKKTVASSDVSNTLLTQKVVASTTSTLHSASSNLMEKFKPVEGSWECPCCMVRNANSAVACACCNTSKSIVSNEGQKVAKASTTIGFGDKFKKPEGAWDCTSCMVQNKAEASECIACGSLKAGAQKSAKLATTTSVGPGLQFNFGIPSTTEGFKFGVDKSDVKDKTDNTAVPAAKFVFGAKSQTTAADQFTFGIPKDDKETVSEVPKVAEFTFRPPETAENNTAFQPCVKSSISIKNKIESKPLDKELKKTVPPFSFGVPKTEESKSSDKKQFTVDAPVTTSAIPAFSFGVLPKSDSNTTEINKDSSDVVFEGSTVQNSKASVPITESIPNPITSDSVPHSVVSVTTQDATKIKSTPSFSFVTSSTVVSTSNTSTTAAVTTTNSIVPTQTTFTFQGSKTTSLPQTSTVSSFGQAPSTVSSSIASSTFAFNRNKKVEATSTLPEKKPIVSFGISPATPAFTVASSTPLFGSNDVKTTCTFGTAEIKPPIFGITDNKMPTFGNVETKAPIFGASENKASTFGSTDKPALVFNTPAPAFGASSTTPTPFGTSSTTGFGNASASTFGSGSASNVFSTKKPNESAVSNTGLFTFGSTSQTTPQPSAGFNFTGSNPAESPAQKPLFTFGSSSSAPQPGSGFGSGTFNTSVPVNPTPGSFTFNAPKPDTSLFGQTVTAVASPPIFGTPQTAPGLVQGQSAPSFVPTASTPNAGFNFGPTPSAAASGAFTFGTATPPSAPSGGFNFNAPSSTSTVSFDPNTRPSFNFTGGSAPTAFNATPQPTSQPTRKIRKAIRRMPPR